MNLRDQNYLRSLVLEFAAMPSETGWLEFKVNKAEPQNIGEYISALANSAALEGRAHAYMLWGVADDGHAIVGTSFDPRTARQGNEELESWLLRLLSPRIGFTKGPGASKPCASKKACAATRRALRGWWDL